MKRFKSPVNLALTFISCVPIVIITIRVGSTPLVPAAAIFFTALIQLLFNRASLPPETEPPFDKDRNGEFERQTVLAAEMSHDRTTNMFRTNIIPDRKDHGAWLGWFAVICAYIALSIAVNDSLLGGDNPVSLKTYYPFFMGIALFAVGDFCDFHFKEKSNRTAVILTAACVITGCCLLIVGLV